MADKQNKHLLYELPPALLAPMRRALAGSELLEEYDTWEQALRGDTAKLEARVKARIATDAELELICDLAARRINPKQYLKRHREELTRACVKEAFRKTLHTNPQAKLTRKAELARYGDRQSKMPSLLDSVKSFGVGRSLAMEIWAEVKRELAESTGVEAMRTPIL